MVMPDFFEGDSVVKSVPEGSDPAVRFAWIKSMTSWDRVRCELCTHCVSLTDCLTHTHCQYSYVDRQCHAHILLLKSLRVCSITRPYTSTVSYMHMANESFWCVLPVWRDTVCSFRPTPTRNNVQNRNCDSLPSHRLGSRWFSRGTLFRCY